MAIFVAHQFYKCRRRKMKEKDSFIHMVRLQDYGFTNVKNCNKLCTSSEKVLFLIAKENVLPIDINIFSG